MARGRALLRNFTATPKPAEARPVKLPPMRGNKTLSAPARPDLWKLDPGPPPSLDDEPVAEESVEAAQAAPVPLALFGAKPVRIPRGGAGRATLVPSAFDAGTAGTLTEDGDLEWFGGERAADADWTDELEDTMDVAWDDSEAVTELPRVLDAAVELTVFFAGLATGLAVQGAFAWLAWTTLIG